MHATAEPRPLALKQVVPLMVALLAAVFAFQLNASMLSPALATMETELGATTSQIGMTQTAFFTAAALFSLFLPRWGDLIGRRKVLVGMMTVTGIGCLVAALAPNVTILLLARVIQGVAGPTVPLTLIMLRQQVANEKQYALLLGVLTSVNGGIAGVDALAGGVLADHFGFRSVFWTMAVICALAVIGVRGWTQESVADATISMDWAGIAPLAVALGCVLTAFNEAGKLADANWLLVVILLLVGAVCLVVFWNIEKRVRHPLVTVDYLKQRRTWALLSTTLLTMTGVFAVMNGLIPNLGQDAEVGAGMSADVVSFYTLTPYALAGLVFGPIAGWMAARVGYKFVLQTGLVGTVVGLIVTVFIVGNPGKLSLLFVSLFIGITYAGIANIMLNGLGIVLSPADNQGYLPGMNAGAFNLGAGLSFAILFGVAGSFDSGYHAGLVTGCIILAAALAMSLLIPKPESIGDTVAAANHD
ncbi:MFS transporter [Corynebacterium sp. HMSC04H06]|uniref:uridine transporter UriT n=1 Tax=Corynebacterium sp. HMSC04H06 TaxID=1581050 RepID=UPI0008A6029C|nr:MFS transporter [Corynebacterium sp. HMSC04H06]OFS23815.1 multidrug ABC transporter [Corynebacterium sp. HMSC04H06]